MSQEMALALLRHALTLVGAWLVSNGYLSTSETEAASGAILILAGAGWSAVMAHRNKRVIVTQKNEIIELKQDVREEKSKNT